MTRLTVKPIDLSAPESHWQRVTYYNALRKFHEVGRKIVAPPVAEEGADNPTPEAFGIWMEACMVLLTEKMDARQELERLVYQYLHTDDDVPVDVALRAVSAHQYDLLIYGVMARAESDGIAVPLVNESSSNGHSTETESPQSGGPIIALPKNGLSAAAPGKSKKRSRPSGSTASS